MESIKTWKSTFGYSVFILFIQSFARDFLEGMQPNIPHRRLCISGCISHVATCHAWSGCLECAGMANVSAFTGETTSPCGPVGTAATFQFPAAVKLGTA